MTTGVTREVSRRAVREQIAEVATRLFIEHGFEETTVDDIAAAVGISQRTYFRYFTSKEEALLHEYERSNEFCVAELRVRPSSETAWDALSSVLDSMQRRLDDPRRAARHHEVHRIVESSPKLLAGFLGYFDGLQAELTSVLQERTPSADPLVLRALVGSAFSCFKTSMAASRDGDLPAATEAFHHLMDTLRPKQ